MLRRLRLRNYRCFNDHTVDFRPITLVVGRNNAGKSSLVEALRLISLATSRYRTGAYREQRWGDIPRVELGFAPSLRGLEISFKSLFHRYGSPPAILDAEFTSGAKLRMYLGGEDRVHVVLFTAGGDVIRTRQAAQGIAIPEMAILPQIGPLQPTERVLSEEYVRGALSSRLASLHFRNQLHYLPEHFAEFKSFAEESWSHLQVRELSEEGRGAEKELWLQVRNEDFVAEVASMGHGLQMWLQTIWFLSRQPRTATVILDEPDVYMHPDLQRRLIRMVRRRYPQVVIATHSVEIMSEVGPDEVLLLDHSRRKSGFTNSVPAVQMVVESIGSAQNIHLARMWTAKKCILVEGDDLTLLKILYDRLFPDDADGLGTLPTLSVGGWGGWERAVGCAELLTHQNGFAVKCYCLFDRDYHSEDEIARRSQAAPLAGIRLKIWKQKEIENYLLSASAIARMIRNRIGNAVEPTREDVQAKIDEIVNDMKDEVIGAIADEIQKNANRQVMPSTAMADARATVDAKWTTPDNRSNIVSGKAVLSALSAWSKTTFNVSFSASGVARAYQADEIPAEMREFLEAVRNGTDL